jgi:hypothetical protein
MRRLSMERKLWRWDAVELAAAIRSRKISSREAVRSVLGRLHGASSWFSKETRIQVSAAISSSSPRGRPTFAAGCSPSRPPR